MKRDMLCISDIIKRLEKPEFDGTIKTEEFLIKGYSKAKVHYHMLLLKDVGYIHTVINQQGNEVPLRLTWQGHEYLFQTLNDTVTIVNKGIDLAEDLI